MGLSAVRKDLGCGFEGIIFTNPPGVWRSCYGGRGRAATCVLASCPPKVVGWQPVTLAQSIEAVLERTGLRGSAMNQSWARKQGVVCEGI